MAKKVSKFFRIGVEGDTCDGRVISAQDIQEMAETFDPRVYGCRINLEHLRGILPDGIFKRYGDVVELKAEKIDDDSALKGKWALFAKITPTDDLIAMNKAAQKVYIGIIGAIGLVAWPVITGINAIIAAAGAMGAVFTTVGSAVMTAIGAISWPVVVVVAAIVAGALLIRKHWEPVSAFFGGVVEGLKAAFAPVGELFTPLKPVFDWLGEKLQAAWQWFKNLIAPVKATQDTLNRCRDTGVMFGQALADALMLPLNAFNKLRSGIDWVLEKLGVINKESDTLDQTAARTHAATYGTGGYIPATSSYAGYQAYQPVTAPAGRSYVDQSKNEYHISLTGGTAPGTQLDRQLQDALEKYERDKRARARASMMHDG